MTDNKNIPTFEQTESSVIRAISNNKNANVILRQRNSTIAVLQEESLSVPHTSQNLSGAEISAIRGMVDSAALELRYHNKEIHKNNSPDKKTNAKEIFNAAEKARFESIGSLQMIGVSKNIDNKIIYDFLHNDYEKNDSDDDKNTNMALALNLLIRQSLTGTPLPSITKDFMNKWGRLIQIKSTKYLNKLTDIVDNQEDFAKVINELINNLTLLDQNNNQEESNNSADEENPTNKSEQDENDNAASEDNPASQEASFEEDFKEKEGNTSKNPSKINHNVDQKNLPELKQLYKPYTTEFDQIIKAEDYYDSEELIYLRKQLDIKLAKLKKVNRKSANLFLRKLLSKHSKSWDFNLESGIIDGRKLASLIATPTYLEYFKQEKESDNNNTIVTLLLDNSGSMRGRPITVAAMSAEIIAQTLEACDIKVEILGFTTAQWKGGKSRRKWQDNDSPKNPGRLNDLHHIIYKSADTPWRKARNNMGAMLKEGILKENIDGEAILWACKRLSYRPEKRRILMVISDGAPVDDSTLSTNSPSYLDNHLHNVIKYIENKSEIELVAIGIGHDVARYYSKATTIKDIDELESTMFQQLNDIFDKRKVA